MPEGPGYAARRGGAAGALLLLGSALAAQAAPQIAPEGIVSAADHSSAALGAARGSIISIYGSDLAAGTASAQGAPLPASLAGTRVRIRASSAELDAGLLYVSAGQINAVIPDAAPLGEAEILVESASGTSSPQQVSIVATRFTAFTTTGRPFGPAVAQQHRRGEVHLNRMLDPAVPGDALVIWGTGLGGSELDGVIVSIGLAQATAFYAGPAPGLPGVDQINVFLPEGAPSNCLVPFAIDAGGERSAVYSISTGTGQGTPCAMLFALGREGLAELDAGGMVRITALTVQETAAEAWIGEYDAAHLSLLATYDLQPFAAAFVCARRSYEYDRFSPPPRMLPVELYGALQPLDALVVSVTGPDDCGWPFIRSADGVYRASAPPGCPPRRYTLAKPGSTNSSAGNVPFDIPLSPLPPVTVDRAAGVVSWAENFSGRLTLELASSFTLPGNIFNGRTDVRELSCRLSGHSGTGRIGASDWSWALGLPSSRRAVLRQWLGGLMGGSWDGPREALFVRMLRVREETIDLQ
jgi:uncharacterized protein (TIGR03437 family)